MMFVIIFASFLTFATAPAIKGIVSRVADPRAQGVTMGSLDAINSLAAIAAPAIGTSILARVAELPRTDWRIGASFFLCAALQAAAWWLARRAPRPRGSAAAEPHAGPSHAGRRLVQALPGDTRAFPPGRTDRVATRTSSGPVPRAAAGRRRARRARAVPG